MNNMLSEALREFTGLLEQLFRNLLGNDAKTWGDELKKFLRKESCWVSTIVRRIKVNRKRTPQETLDATGRKQYTDSVVVSGMPKSDGEEVELVFFQPDKSAYVNGLISDDELENQFELRGLKPDPYAQMAVNEADPAFADEKPNGTHWKNTDGKWCYLAFGRWCGGRRGVDVGRGGGGWSAGWWFAGVRK